MFISSLSRLAHFNRCSGRACSELELIHSRKVFCLVSKDKHVSTCKPTIGGLDDSINLDSKAPPGACLVYQVGIGIIFHSCWFEVFILEQISEKAKESLNFDVGTIT
ncbi:hypothetical protein CEXT_545131 [Caerostris extrusa]|uniref:Uncharacterized protein n=1 Tax=Caerostris extrusa TaxID=172846 RepID=A0AAV4M918_CAEEX|nr:hypothetical protein CEXT_545131 [Caerostris extrusa]